MHYRTRTVSLKQNRTGLISLATQYLPDVQSSDGIIIVFSHSTSNRKSAVLLASHTDTVVDKEQWEIIIAQLFEICPASISEAWAIDWQNHGQSAIVNKELLTTRIATLEDYADILRQFLESPHLVNKKVVVLGHSTGTCAWILALFQTTLPVSPVIAVVFFEPVCILPPIVEKDDRMLRGVMNIRGVKLRKDTFASIDEAAKWTRKRMPWKTWDERMFNCYLEYGFRAAAPDSKKVILNCALDQEVEACAPNIPVLAGHLYSKLCSIFPVHGIFGERPEMYTNKTRDRFYDGNEGRCMASVQIIPKAGHLLVQEYPDIATAMIAKILKTHTAIKSSKL